MSGYAQDLADLLQQQVAGSQAVVSKMGTVVTRDGTGAGASVIFHGSSATAVDVKCFESVLVAPGDLVGLVRYESDWIITGNYSPRLLADTQLFYSFTANGTIATTGAFQNAPESPTLTFTKVRDATRIEFGMSWDIRTDTAATTIEVGARLTKDDVSVDFDTLLRRRVFSVAGSHDTVVGAARTATAAPAGEYTAVARWRRVSASGTFTTDANDGMSFTAREVY